MYGTLYMNNNITSFSGNIWLSNGYAIGEYSTGNNRIEFYTTKLSLITNGNDVMTLFNSGNVAIGTTTDNSFKLDVNGTARVVGPTFAVGDWTSRSASVYVRALAGGSENRGFYIGKGASNDGNVGSFTFQDTTNTLNIRSPYNNGTIALSFDGNTNSIQFHNQSGTAISKFFSNTGNLGINTTTDAGYKLDVNGTTIIRGVLNVGTISTGFNFSGADCAIFNNGGSGGAISLSMGGNTYLRIYQPINAGSGITVGAVNTITTPITYAWASGTASPNLFQLNPNYNFTGTYSGIVRGFYYNPSLSSMTGVTHYAIHSTSGRVRLEGLPTSPTGLSAGDLYNDGGIIKIV